ncbi:ATP-binding protein [Streptomyces sp. bgisy153]|uniref:ATP-binding protein n=1 Tax=Streptomyces sp. bgisy153 TaxID=3413793 RepID=UPI003D71B2B5
MNARKSRQHERVRSELEAYAHWFAAPDPSTGGRFLAVTLFAESRSVAQVARDMTAQFLRDTEGAAVVDNARLAVSELVGNVVNHAVPDRPLTLPGGCRRIDVTFRMWPKWLFIGITDEDSSPPLLPLGETVSPDLAGEFIEAVLPDSGRGLLIVQHLADAVWWTPGDQGGKTVWCRFDLDDSAGGRSAW